MTARISHDEWQAALRTAEVESARNVGPEGFTVWDLVAMLGVGPDCVQGRIRTWVREGSVEFVGLKPGVSMDGRKTRGTPVYRTVAK